MILLSALALATSAQALERQFAKGYEYASLPVCTNEAESGLSLYKDGVAYARKDSSFILSMPDSVGQASTKQVNDEMLSDLRYDGQFAYDEKNQVIYVSHEGLLYSVSTVNGKSAPVQIEGLSAHREEFASGSSLAYRRWRYKVPGVTGLYNPALNSKGDKLYFSAELAGGKGGTDIWMVTKKSDGSWSAPANVASVNSKSNEDYPFIAGDSLLYFSSDRPDTLAGWNVFRSRLKGKPEVAMLPEGINSKGNDYNFVGNGKAVYVLSDRDGNVDVFGPVKKEEPVVETPVDTVVPVDTTPAIKEEPKVEEKMPEFEPCTFYFKFDKTEFVKNYDAEIKRTVAFINHYSDAIIEISGHTDVRGGDAYNQDLSQRRCKAVYDCLVKAGVSPKNLRSVGYGKSQLALPNANDAQSHLLNRRVIIKVVQ